MNKEIEELLNKLKKCRDYDDEVLLIKQYGANLLLSYIEQLENNRDKAIERIQYEEMFDDDNNHLINFKEELKYILLKGGSDE